MPSTATQSEEIFDARELPCEIKRPAMIGRCLALPLGRSFTFVNGHDPVPLRGFLDQQFPGCFRWELLDCAATDVVHLRVTKTAEPPGGFPAAGVDFACS